MQGRGSDMPAPTFDLWSTEGQTHLLSFHQLFCDAFLAQGRSHLVAESVDDVFRSARRCKNAPPGIGFESGKAALSARGYSRYALMALFSGLHDRTNCAGLDLRHRQRGAADEKLYVASHGVVHRWTAAAIRHMGEFDAGALRQQRHREMSDAAAADRAVTHFARIVLGEGEHIGQRLVRLG